MDLIPLAGSSLITGYGWEENAENRQLFKGRIDARAQRLERFGCLQLQFNTGARWYYFEVPVHLFESWLMSKSKGHFFHKWIRGKYGDKAAEEVERVQSSA